jgi:hypothetical protein
MTLLKVMRMGCPHFVSRDIQNAEADDFSLEEHAVILAIQAAHMQRRFGPLEQHSQRVNFGRLVIDSACKIRTQTEEELGKRTLEAEEETTQPASRLLQILVGVASYCISSVRHRRAHRLFA